MEYFNRQKEKIKAWYRDLPEKKRYIELITAILSIPVLVTVILLNLGNLSKNNSGTKTNKEITPIKIEIKTGDVSPTKIGGDTQVPTILPVSPSAYECKKTVGPVEISSPKQGETIINDPVCVLLDYKKGEYCAYVWSYRINDSRWSEFTDKNICLYNLSSGEKKLEVKVKSIASGDEVILRREFVYNYPDLSPSISTNSASF